MKTSIAVLLTVFAALMFLVVGSAKGDEGNYLICDTPEQVEYVISKLPDIKAANARIASLNKEAGKMVCGMTNGMTPIADMNTVMVGGIEYIIVAVMVMMPMFQGGELVAYEPMPQFTFRMKKVEGSKI